MKGFALLEVAIAITMVAVLGMLAMPIYSTWAMNNRMNHIHNEAGLLLVALEEHYRRNCAIVPFPQPTLANLQSQRILVHTTYTNPYGGQFSFDIAGVGTSTPVATVRLPFNDVATATMVSVRNRASSLSASQVIWRRTLSTHRSNSGEIGMSGQNIFSTNGC
jgi:Tfp pilus assembly protein PilE